MSVSIVANLFSSIERSLIAIYPLSSASVTVTPKFCFASSTPLLSISAYSNNGLPTPKVSDVLTISSALAEVAVTTVPLTLTP